jgi:hypothetical protein
LPFVPPVTEESRPQWHVRAVERVPAVSEALAMFFVARPKQGISACNSSAMQIREQQGHGLRGHRRAAIGVQRDSDPDDVDPFDDDSVDDVKSAYKVVRQALKDEYEADVSDLKDRLKQDLEALSEDLKDRLDDF